MGRPFVRTSSAVVNRLGLGLVRWGPDYQTGVSRIMETTGLTEYIGGSWETPGPERGDGVSK